MKNPADISKLQVSIYVIKTGETGFINDKMQEGHLYFSTTYPNELGVVYEDGAKRTKYITHDFSNIFKW